MLKSNIGSIDWVPYATEYYSLTKQLPYYRKGVLLSEGFFVHALCKYYKVNTLIESGIHNGRSTVIFVNSKAAPNIHSIDFKIKDDVRKFAEVKSDIKISLWQDNSCSIIPMLLKSTSGNIGIFIDGPKGAKACQMAQEYFKYENVKFIAIHDQCKWHNNHLMDKFFNDVVYSDEDWFRNGFGYMDENDVKYLSFLDNIKEIEKTGFGVGAIGK
jgi:hypothetical protein